MLGGNISEGSPLQGHKSRAIDVLDKGARGCKGLAYTVVTISFLYWVTQKLPQICSVILRIRIGKVA